MNNFLLQGFLEKIKRMEPSTFTNAALCQQSQLVVEDDGRDGDTRRRRGSRVQKPLCDPVDETLKGASQACG